MSPSLNHCLRLAAAAAICGAALGCDLDPNCDPEVDENCDPVFDGSDAGADADVGGGGSDTDTGGGGTEVFRYVYIFDLGDGRGSHPGADIDAIERFSNGQSTWASGVTDRYFEPGVSSDATDTSQITGPPDIASGSAHTCDVGASIAHWYSLGPGGWIVVDMGPQGLRDGDELIVYECAGVDDPYGVSIGTTPRLDDPNARFVEITLDAVGYSRAVLDFSALGID